MCSNPDYDLEAFEQHLDICLQKTFDAPSKEDAFKLLPVFQKLEEYSSVTTPELNKLLAQHKLSQYRKNSFLIQSLYILSSEGAVSEDLQQHVINLLRIKRCKSHSGILSITVFTSPYPSYIDDAGNLREQKFTCNWNCHYCPNEPGQPRSYLKGEPGVMRANRYKFDACQQMWGRLHSLHSIGHTIKGAKLEVLILGGTFTSYPVRYREQFVRDIYYAANTVLDTKKRDRLCLAEEMRINKDSEVRVIGLTVEFRPDCVTRQELFRLRSYGCTRVQLGVQHTDDTILKAINRQCTTDRFKKGLKLLKDVGYKVDIHIMTNLPFSSPEIDRDMLLSKLLGVKSPPRVEEGKDGVRYEYWDIEDPDLSADQ